MARWEFKLPDIGEGVTEGEIVAWLIKPGDRVIEDQPMIEVMTDKATVTIASPKAGRVLETVGLPGAVVPVHSVLVVFDIDGAVPEAMTGSGATSASESPVWRPLAIPREASSRSGYFSEKPLATPATRKLARELGVDLRAVPPTGDQGRVTHADVERFGRALGAASPSESHPVSEARPMDRMPVAPVDESPERGSSERAAARANGAISHVATLDERLEERVPFTGVRRKIAQKMAQSVHTAAHFTFVEECDCTALKALRTRLKPMAEAKGVKLTFLPFIVKAVVAALKRSPVLNSTLDEAANELVYRKFYNLGIAASTAGGLIVPVVKEADRKSLLAIAQDIDRLANDAKSGKSKKEDLQGSTFTITSLGADGGLFATPILNFPEVGILGVHQMKQKPVVRNGQIVIGDVMLLSLSFDHRIVDGHVGAAFAYDVIGYLQEPDRLFLEI